MSAKQNQRDWQPNETLTHLNKAANWSKNEDHFSFQVVCIAATGLGAIWFAICISEADIAEGVAGFVVRHAHDLHR